MENWTNLLVRGNLVDFDGVVATIVELRVNNCRIRYKRRDTGEEHTSLVEYYRLKPLVLNEERLVGWLGFKRDLSEFKLYPCPEIQIIVYNEGNYNGVMFYTRTIHTDYVPVYVGSHINNIHEIQNLYTSLKGEELPVNTEAINKDASREIHIRQKELESIPRFQKKGMSLNNTLVSMVYTIVAKEEGTFTGIPDEFFDRSSLDKEKFQSFLKEFNILCIISPDRPDLQLRASDEAGCRELEKLLMEAHGIKF